MPLGVLRGTIEAHDSEVLYAETDLPTSLSRCRALLSNGGPNVLYGITKPKSKTNLMADPPTAVCCAAFASAGRREFSSAF